MKNYNAMKKLKKGEKNYIIKITAFWLFITAVVLASMVIVSVLIKNNVL